MWNTLDKRALATASSMGILLMLVQATAVAAEDKDPTLATVVVTGAEASEAQKAQKELKKVAGNTAVVDNRDIERGRAANAEDVLALQPGVFAQATSGSSANKISIRGSGLNTFYQGYVLGIKFLYDGLPLTGPGGTQEDMLDMASVDHTEVLYGANAYRYSALSLGGAINFVDVRRRLRHRAGLPGRPVRHPDGWSDPRSPADCMGGGRRVGTRAGELPA